MPATFGCPECGEPITLPENPSGRQVRCAECLTLVEIPYFTRSRPRRRRRTTGWAWVAIAFGLAVIVAVGTFLLVRSRLRVERLSVFEREVESARREEASGQFEAARSAVEQALAAAGTLGIVGPDRIDSLQETRRRLERRIELEKREALIRSAESDLSVVDGLFSRTPLDAARALELVTSAFQAAKQVADPRADALQHRARELACSLVERRGVRFDPVSGPFLFDPETAVAEYARRLHPILSRFLTARGYLPEPEESPLSALWEQRAPYRLAVTASEAYGLNYLQSRNRMTRIESNLALRLGSETPWTSRLVAKTRVPSRAFSAFESGYIGASPKREEKIEGQLYVDALDDLVDQLPGKLETLPRWAEIH